MADLTADRIASNYDEATEVFLRRFEGHVIPEQGPGWQCGGRTPGEPIAPIMASNRARERDEVIALAIEVVALMRVAAERGHGLLSDFSA